ncbi:tetraspanin-18-like isoform X2 [Scleropages formosus]|uniref:tetraspanin-18-like isoform X2 n=1 Tax=Scleropages formosus TaxID=113540 RepID=UPI00087881D6|nr:tetraspanin-18-like isoform X2 [Scleropages formosus]
MARIEKLYHCLRVLMMALCGIIFLSGFAFLGFGAWMKHDSFYYAKVTGLFFEHLVNLAYICLGMGALLCLVGITGFCAAMKENWCLITLSFSSLAVLFCTKIFGTIFVFAYRDLSVVIVRDVGKKSLQTAYMGPAATDPVSTVWNTIITTYECCGFENSIVDFEKSVFSTTTGLKYPKICCVDKNSNKCNELLWQTDRWNSGEVLCHWKHNCCHLCGRVFGHDDISGVVSEAFKQGAV